MLALSKCQLFHGAREEAARKGSRFGTPGDESKERNRSSIICECSPTSGLKLLKGGSWPAKARFSFILF